MKYSSVLNLFKSGVNLFSGIQTGKFSYSSGFVQELKNDVSALRAFQQAVKNGTDTTTAISTAMQNASVAAKNYATNNKITQASIRDYITLQKQSQVTNLASSSSFKDQVAVIKAYNNSMQTTRLTQDQFREAVNASNPALGKYLNSVKAGEASTKGYIGSLIEAKIASIGLKIATVALNIALTSLISIGISAFARLITDAMNASKKSIEDAADSINELKNNLKTLDDYRDKIIELRTALDKGGLSIGDITNKRGELFEIQKQLIDGYGDEARGIDFVTGSLEKQLQVYDALKVKKQEQWLDDNRTGIQNAYNFLYSDKPDPAKNYLILDPRKEGFVSTGTPVNPTGVSKFLADWVSNNDNVVDEWEGAHKAGIRFIGNRMEILNAYDKLLDDLKTYESTQEGLTKQDKENIEALKTAISGAKKYITDNDRYDDSVQTYTQATEYVAKTRELYKNYYDDINKYQKEYDDAVIQGNDEAAKKSYAKVQSAYKNLFENGDFSQTLNGVRGEDVKQWFKDQQKDFAELSVPVRLKIDIEGTKREFHSTKGELTRLYSMVGENGFGLNVDSRGIPTSVAGYNNVSLEQANEFNTIKDAAKAAGVSIESYIEALVQYGKVRDDTFTENSGQKLTSMLTKYSDALTKLKTAYDLADEAEKEMVDGGLSPETVKKLADANEEYVDYLYEENGVIKLNTEAWKENADKGVREQMSALQQSQDVLLEEKEGLKDAVEAVERYNAAKREAESKGINPDNDGSVKAAYDSLKTYADKYGVSVDELINKCNGLSSEINTNETAMRLLEGAFNSITNPFEKLNDAYGETLSNFENINSLIQTISSSMTTLADLQETVANGFTLSLDKALEFASVYPQILDGAMVSADGQITLNEDIVNSFIESKQAELKAEIDKRIHSLQSEKEEYKAKKEFAEAQLGLAKSVGEGEGQITAELCEYRLNASNALLDALIKAGVEESTAYKLAIAAMAGNAEEFNRVARDVCTDVAGNFNEAAYAAAQAIYENMENGKKDISSITQQAQEFGKAMAAATAGNVAGDTNIKGGSGGGKKNFNTNIHLTSGKYKGTDYSYTPQKITLDKFISDVKLDISSFENAMKQIDGQIAALEAMKNIPLEHFSTSYKDKAKQAKKEAEKSSKEAEKSAEKADSWFEQEYKSHQHYRKMEQESEADYLKWLTSAHQTAFAQGIISLDDYRKYQEEIYDGLKNLASTAESSIKELVNIRLNMLKDEIEREKEALNTKLSNLKDFYQKQKDMLQESYDNEKYLEEQAEKRKSVADIQAEIDQLRFDDSAKAHKRRVELEKELKEANKTLSDFERDHTLKTAQSQYDKLYEQQEKSITEETAARLYEKALNDVRNGSVSLYNEMIAWNEKYGDGIRDTITKAWESAYKAEKNYFDYTGQHYNGVSLANATGYYLGKTGYASGTSHSTAGIHRVDERGIETIFQSADGQRYRMFSSGEKVLNASASDFLYKFANKGREILGKLFGETSRSYNNVVPGIVANNIQQGDIIIQGNADKATVSEIRRAQRDNLEQMLKQLNRLK